MNRYQPALPRVAISFAAVALSALTLGLSVLPAQLGSNGHDTRFEARARAGESVAATRGPVPIVVYGFGQQTTAYKSVRNDLPTAKVAG